MIDDVMMMMNFLQYTLSHVMSSMYFINVYINL